MHFVAVKRYPPTQAEHRDQQNAKNKSVAPLTFPRLFARSFPHVMKQELSHARQSNSYPTVQKQNLNSVQLVVETGVTSGRHHA